MSLLEPLLEYIIKKLMMVINQKISSKTVDDTVYFILNALWDLTGNNLSKHIFIDILKN